ncbi:MAG: hypothetical protein ABL996_20810, partial [Micropepsaceae bacterium]
ARAAPQSRKDRSSRARGLDLVGAAHAALCGQADIELEADRLGPGIDDADERVRPLARFAG